MADKQVRAFQGGVTKAVGERQVRVVMSTPRIDRHGDIVDIAGIDLSEYRRNPVVLWQHDHDEPIARCVEVGIVGGQLQAVVLFPPEGTSEDADEAYRLVKAGVVSAVSIGFIPKADGWVHIDPKDPWAGFRYTAVDLIELSFVSVPANPDALVIERSALHQRRGPELLLDAAVAQIATLKAGRVLSRANEEKLRAAHLAIGEVLAQVGEDGAKPKTLYVKRSVLNGAEIREWARALGFPQTLPPEDMHVTVAFSKAALDWSPLTPAADQVTITGGQRAVMPLGDKGAIVLRIESAALAERWQAFRDAGASWDYEGYKPHVTVTYRGGLDPAQMPAEAFAGDIILGPEVFSEVKSNWDAEIREMPFFAACDGCADPAGCAAAGACASRQKAARLRAVAARLRAAGLAA